MSQLHTAQHAPAAASLAFRPFVQEPGRVHRGPALEPGHVTGELRFCQLHTPAEISRVMHLRRELRLPGAGMSDASFAALEKKETSWGSWALSSGRAAASEPSA